MASAPIRLSFFFLVRQDLLVPSRDLINPQRPLVTPARIAISGAWLASLIVIYFIGTTTNSSQSAADRSTNSGQEDPSGGAAANPMKFASQFSEADPAAIKALEAVLQRAGALLAFRAGFNNTTEDQIAGIKQLLAIEDAQIPLAIAMAGKLNYDASGLVYAVLVERWAKIDGRAALQYTLAEQSKTGLPMSAMLQWTRKQPEAAWQWFQSAKVEEPCAPA